MGKADPRRRLADKIKKIPVSFSNDYPHHHPNSTTLLQSDASRQVQTTVPVCCQVSFKLSVDVDDKINII